MKDPSRVFPLLPLQIPRLSFRILCESVLKKLDRIKLEGVL